MYNYNKILGNHTKCLKQWCSCSLVWGVLFCLFLVELLEQYLFVKNRLSTLQFVLLLNYFFYIPAFKSPIFLLLTQQARLKQAYSKPQYYTPQKMLWRKVKVATLKQTEQGFSLETFPQLNAVTNISVCRSPDLYVTHTSSYWLLSPRSTWVLILTRYSISTAWNLFAKNIFKKLFNKSNTQEKFNSRKWRNKTCRHRFLNQIFICEHL